MARFRYQLPPLNYFVAFEAAAKHSNFTEAARSLNVARTAISYQIKAIESFVGKPLFHRLNRSVRLTSEGEKLFTVVSRSLEEILDTVHEIENGTRENSLAVTMTTGFSAYWFLPRISSFRDQYPTIEVKMVVTDRYVNLDEENIDVAIRYYRDDLIDPNAGVLFRHQIAPTCSSSYKTSLDVNSTVEDLLNEKLIYLEGRKYDARSKWRSWFSQHGIQVSEMPPGISVDDYAALILACESGAGVALLGPPLVTEQLATGRLRQPTSFAPISIGSFCLKTVSLRPPNKAVLCFVEWIERYATESEKGDSEEATMGTPQIGG